MESGICSVIYLIWSNSFIVLCSYDFAVLNCYGCIYRVTTLASETCFWIFDTLPLRSVTKSVDVKRLLGWNYYSWVTVAITYRSTLLSVSCHYIVINSQHAQLVVAHTRTMVSLLRGFTGTVTSLSRMRAWMTQVCKGLYMWHRSEVDSIDTLVWCLKELQEHSGGPKFLTIWCNLGILELLQQQIWIADRIDSYTPAVYKRDIPNDILKPRISPQRSCTR